MNWFWPNVGANAQFRIDKYLKRIAGLKWHTALDGISMKTSPRKKSSKIILKVLQKKVKYLNSSLKILHNLRQNNSNAFKNKSHFSNTFRNMESKL